MRFLIADDQPLFRQAVRVQIERFLDDAIVEEIGAVDQLLSCVREDSAMFDILLLNSVMTGMSVSALHRITAQYPATPVAILSAPAGTEAIRQYIGAGARGFIPRAATGEQLVLAVQLLLAGGTIVPASVFICEEEAELPDFFEAHRETPTLNMGWVAGLNERERAVLNGVARGESNKEIAMRLDMAEVTVKFHLRVLFRKINVENRVQLAVAAAKARLI